MFFIEFLKTLFKKIGSAKLWVTIWAMYELHYLIHTGKDLGTVAILLTSVPLSYMGLNVLQDFIFSGNRTMQGK